jgi:ATP-dependent Clp endopeptidase proteolytic subunit ClpP
MPTNPPIVAAPAVQPSAVRSWYAINRKADVPDEAEISIYDSIGGWGISAKQFISELKGLNAKQINLRINSPGGEITEATAIYNALVEHPARIVSHVDGIAASAGSFVAMAGNEVRMADNAYMMIHNAHGGVMGEADEMRTYADVLDKMNGNIAEMYAKKSGRPAEHWRSLMSAETWFTAQEAKDQGLADVVYAPEKKQAVRISNGFDLKMYNHVPQAVMSRFGEPAFIQAVQKQITVENGKPVIVKTDSIFQAPEASPRGEPPSAVPSNEVQTPMPTDNPPVVTAPPAPTPAAVVMPPVPQVAPSLTLPLSPSPDVRGALEQFQAIQGPQFFEQGRKKGAEEATAAYADRIRTIVAICAGKPDMAINAILSGQTPEAVKLAYDSLVTAEAVQREAIGRKDVEILRLQSLLALGGHPGVALGVDTGVPEDVDPGQIADPKAHAEREWDFNPKVRKGFSGKDSYVAYRVRELKGTVQLARASASDD